MKDFFISYNKADQQRAEWIAWQLEEAGYTTIIQAWDFRPGSNFVLEMQKAAEEAERTIAVLSPDYLDARFTQAEWAAAFAQDPTGEKGVLVPVRVRKCELKGLLSQIIYIDLVDLKEKASKNTLLDGIRHKKRAKPKTEPVLPDEIKSFERGIKWYRSKRHKFDPFSKAGQIYAQMIAERYGTMRIFGMTEPVPLRNIYTRVNILEKITSYQRMTIDELETCFDRDKRGFGKIRETKEGIQVANELYKIILLGKPGSGKTTFLKYLTLQTVQGKIKNKLIPVFVSLKDFSDSNKSLIKFIEEQFDICHFPQAEEFIERILQKCKCLILLDGLDEVSQDKTEETIKHIRDFSDKYSHNQFIISCRIAAHNYCFEKFTDAEMADFDDGQIENFVNNWFGMGMEKADLCWKKIKENKAIKELAAIPLLLTMLCLAFDETNSFPSNKAELYKEAIDALLKKWDSSRCIKRDEIYKNLSFRYKEKMLSQIAATTFEKSQYFFPQRVLETHIIDFIKNLPGFKKEELEPESEVILKSIEAQHGLFVERAKGIYSFSHLTFQEYFTAKYIVDNATKGTLKQLVEKNHLIDDKWRDVFLSTAEMLEEADEFFLLMKAKIDIFVACKKKKFTKLLNVIKNSIVKKDAPYSSSACRALAISYFLSNGCDSDVNLALVRHFLTFGKHLNSDLIRRTICCALDLACALDDALDDAFARSARRYNIIWSGLGHALLGLTDDSYRSCNICFDNALASKFDHAPARKIDDDRDFLKLLEVYLNANKLLVDCLKTECYVSKQTRQKILDELFTVPES